MYRQRYVVTEQAITPVFERRCHKMLQSL